MSARSPVLWTLVLVIGACGAADAGPRDHDQRYVNAKHKHDKAWKRYRRASRHRAWESHDYTHAPPDESLEVYPRVVEPPFYDNEMVCSGDDEVQAVVELMIDGALAALSESAISSPLAQAAAAAMAAMDTGDACLD